RRTNTPPTTAWAISQATSSAKASAPPFPSGILSRDIIVKQFLTFLSVIPLAASGISLTIAAREPSSISTVAPPKAYLGFDRNLYPGDAAFPTLRQTFAFTSYWLNTP